MKTLLNNPEAVEKMRVAGKLAADVLVMLDEYVKEGVTTGALDKLAHDYIVDVQKAIPANVGYHGYQHTLCTSINHVVCHGIPDDSRILKDGDIVNIDVTVIKDGYHGDTSKMWIIGEGSIMAQRICKIAQDALYAGMKAVRNGAYVGDIGAAIQEYAEASGFSVVREFVGHGISNIFHTAPQVPHYGTRGKGKKLRAGMVFTIEPMINEGTWESEVQSDKWTALTRDRLLSAQFEHTIAVTNDGVEVLTLRPGETYF